MSIEATSVLDASALLAYLQGEPGAAIVATALTQDSVINSINWAETLTKLAERGQDPDVVATQLTHQGLLNNALLIYPTDELLARSIAKLRVPTQPWGLSLGDRACLALALSLNLPALTSDRIWTHLNIGVSVTFRLIVMMSLAVLENSLNVINRTGGQQFQIQILTTGTVYLEDKGVFLQGHQNGADGTLVLG